MAGNKKKKGELDSLKAEMTTLSEALWALRERLTVQAAADAAQGAANTGTRRATSTGEGGRVLGMEARTRMGEETGFVSTYGYFEAGDRGYRWALEDEPVAGLLAVDDGLAAQLLSALGHRQRLAILKAIIERPRSAAELVDRLGLGTTGAAYHHLNVLQAADIVVQESRGIFAFHGQRVPGFLTLLAGIAGMLDTGFAEGPFALAELDASAEDGAG